MIIIFQVWIKTKLFSAFYNKERFKLAESYQCYQNNTSMIVLKNLETGEKSASPVSIIANDEELIEQMSPRDIKKISFISAMDHFKQLIKGIHG